MNICWIYTEKFRHNRIDKIWQWEYWNMYWLHKWVFRVVFIVIVFDKCRKLGFWKNRLKNSIFDPKWWIAGWSKADRTRYSIHWMSSKADWETIQYQDTKWCNHTQYRNLDIISELRKRPLNVYGRFAVFQIATAQNPNRFSRLAWTFEKCLT